MCPAILTLYHPEADCGSTSASSTDRVRHGYGSLSLALDSADQSAVRLLPNIGLSRDSRYVFSMGPDITGLNPALKAGD